MKDLITTEVAVNAGEEAKIKRRKCRECDSENVRRSHMRGPVERGFLKPLGVRAYRCESCDARYYEFPWKERKTKS